ncbi:MAG: hypothetical protein JOZ63_18230 [Planctomycetaceae bacterium]|nr:hypothetical protein [Planctomycetaceae bacterium]MBV8609159.1 hypothetical protein [Singulisphaera sp.]
MLTSLRSPEKTSALEAGDRSGPLAEGRPAEAAPRAEEGRHAPAFTAPPRPARPGPVVSYPVGR